MTEIIDAIDWQGRPVSCTGCEHEMLQAASGCRLLHACVRDRYALRIDRFFTRNQGLASAYLRHPHFEVRAIAAKFADLFLLPPLLDDPDETVRWNAARRLPKRYALRLRRDPHREVRIRIATLLVEEADLIPMIHDPDYYVRLVLARRVGPGLLARLVADPEPEVRRAVARRAPVEWLVGMARDSDADVRYEAAQRLRADLLAFLKHDRDWRVRFEVASRLPLRGLADMAGDEDRLVREMVTARLSVPAVTPTGRPLLLETSP